MRGEPTLSGFHHALILGAIYLCLFAISIGTSLIIGSGPHTEVEAETVADDASTEEASTDQAVTDHAATEEAHAHAEQTPQTSASDTPVPPETADHSDTGLPERVKENVLDEELLIDADVPLLAVVIDDWGYGWSASDDFLALEIPLNVAVIPHLPFTKRHAERAAAKGHQVILHLPMEPTNTGWDLGEGAVTTVMSRDEIMHDVARAWESVPFVSGINNHMGSKATADERVVAAVLAVAKEHGAFFLDSRTTAKSVVAPVAEALNVQYLVNDRFIDPDTEPDRVTDRLLSAAKIARERGWAVAIGHVHSATYEGLVAALPLLEREGVRLAYLREVLVRAVE